MPDPRTPDALCVNVLLDLDAPSPAVAIEQLAASFTRLPSGPAPRALAAAVLEREAQASTYVGHQTALPHARLPTVAHLAVAFGRTRKPVLWTPAGDAVRLIFLGAVPAGQPRHYLEFMRALGRLLHSDAAIAPLLDHSDEAAVRAWLATHLHLR